MSLICLSHILLALIIAWTEREVWIGSANDVEDIDEGDSS